MWQSMFDYYFSFHLSEMTAIYTRISSNSFDFIDEETESESITDWRFAQN